MSAKHTPGPWMWTVAGPHMADDYTQPYAIAEHGKANLIAGVFGDVKGGDETARANALLITAAPDLKHGCTEALNALLDYVERLEKQGCTMGYGRAVIRLLTVAISKAEIQ